MLYATSIYSIYRIYELLLLTVDQFGVDFCFKACALCVRLLQKHRLQYVYATVLWHCQSADDQSCPIHSYAFLQKNAIITSLHKEYLTDSVKIKLPSVDIHLQIFAESFLKFVQKTVTNMWKNKCITFYEHGV